jgi:hypothetical protein
VRLPQRKREEIMKKRTFFFSIKGTISPSCIYAGKALPLRGNILMYYGVSMLCGGMGGPGF